MTTGSSSASRRPFLNRRIRRPCSGQLGTRVRSVHGEDELQFRAEASTTSGRMVIRGRSASAVAPARIGWRIPPSPDVPPGRCAVSGHGIESSPM